MEQKRNVRDEYLANWSAMNLLLSVTRGRKRAVLTGLIKCREIGIPSRRNDTGGIRGIDNYKWRGDSR